MDDQTFKRPDPPTATLLDVHLKWSAANQELSEQIQRKQDFLLNNSLLSCDAANVSWLQDECLKMMEQLPKTVNKTSLPELNEEGFIEVRKAVRAVYQDQLDLLNLVDEEIRRDQEELSQMKESLEFMEVNMQNGSGPIELEKKDYVKISHDISLEFRKVRENLSYVLKECFSESTKHLIQDLTEAYFSKEDGSYVTLTPEELDTHILDIELLKRSSIIQAHPYDKYKFKIDF